MAEGFVLLGRGGEQIAQALLQGEALSPGTGPERGHYLIIQLPDQKLRHGAFGIAIDYP